MRRFLFQCWRLVAPAVVISSVGCANFRIPDDAVVWQTTENACHARYQHVVADFMFTTSTSRAPVAIVMPRAWMRTGDNESASEADRHDADQRSRSDRPQQRSADDAGTVESGADAPLEKLRSDHGDARTANQESLTRNERADSSSRMDSDAGRMDSTHQAGAVEEKTNAGAADARQAQGASSTSRASAASTDGAAESDAASGAVSGAQRLELAASTNRSDSTRSAADSAAAESALAHSAASHEQLSRRDASETEAGDFESSLADSKSFAAQTARVGLAACEQQEFYDDLKAWETFPELTIVKRARQKRVLAGREVRFTVTLHNPGTLTTRDINVIDPLPAHLQFVGIRYTLLEKLLPFLRKVRVCDAQSLTARDAIAPGGRLQFELRYRADMPPAAKAKRVW